MLTQIRSATDIIFIILGQFLPHYWPQKLKLGKNANENWRYNGFTRMHHKSRSCDEWFLKYKIVKNKVFSHYGPFFALWPSQQPKKSKFWKNKETLEMLSFYTCIPQMTTIWCIFPEASSVTNIIFRHFWQFWKNQKNSWRCYHFTHEYHK